MLPEMTHPIVGRSKVQYGGVRVAAQTAALIGASGEAERVQQQRVKISRAVKVDDFTSR